MRCPEAREKQQRGRRTLPAAGSLERGNERLWALEDNEPVVTKGDDAATERAREKALSVHPGLMQSCESLQAQGPGRARALSTHGSRLSVLSFLALTMCCHPGPVTQQLGSHWAGGLGREEGRFRPSLLGSGRSFSA